MYMSGAGRGGMLVKEAMAMCEAGGSADTNCSRERASWFYLILINDGTMRVIGCRAVYLEHIYRFRCPHHDNELLGHEFVESILSLVATAALPSRVRFEPDPPYW